MGTKLPKKLQERLPVQLLLHYPIGKIYVGKRTTECLEYMKTIPRDETFVHLVNRWWNTWYQSCLCSRNLSLLEALEVERPIPGLKYVCHRDLACINADTVADRDARGVYHPMDQRFAEVLQNPDAERYFMKKGGITREQFIHYKATLTAESSSK